MARPKIDKLAPVEPVKLNSAITVSTAISGLFTQMFAQTEKVPCVEPYVRPSSCPSCAIPLFIEICNGRVLGGKFYQDTDYLREYYTEVGNTTHTLLQRWLGMSGNLLGNWSCTCQGLDKDGKPKLVRELSTNNKCPHCKQRAEYVEIEFDEEGIKGHVDGILRFKIKGKKYYIIIDFKGTSSLGLNQNKHAIPPKYPTKKNSKQIGLYAHIFKKHYDWNVVGWALIYTARDSTKQYLVCPKVYDEKDWKEAEAMFNSQVLQQKILTKTLEDFNIDRLLKHKLCRCNDHYTNDVKDQYHACEYAPVCFSNTKKLKELLTHAGQRLLEYNKTTKTVNIKKKKKLKE